MQGQPAPYLLYSLPGPLEAPFGRSANLLVVPGEGDQYEEVLEAWSNAALLRCRAEQEVVGGQWPLVFLWGWEVADFGEAA